VDVAVTVTELFVRGGPVVWVLAVWSVLGLAIVLDRWLHFLRMGRSPSDFEHLPGGEKVSKSLRGPEGAVINAMLAAQRRGVRDLVRMGSRVRADELKRMEYGLRTLGLLGNTAPLLGLLGTILGMIKAFMVIEQAGGRVDAQALAGGIWEAMITTGVGLAVAIPLLILLHFLESSVMGSTI
jgi:biopolymer transport protein ExbB